MEEKIAIIGLGYVGLPVAIASSDKFAHTVGFDINPERVAELIQGIDRTDSVKYDKLKQSSLKITSSLKDLEETTFFIVTVPTPIDTYKKPDLNPLIKASETIGKVLKHNSIVVYESTVYPGVTEEICGSVLAKISGLKQGVDFKLGYSPERVNPGDQSHTLEKITKVVSGEDTETLERVSKVYEAIIDAGIYRAQSIKVAETAKVIENTQRDLNIALMNEIALICDRLNIRTYDVLEAAQTKWNFLPFTPGLVGGHCIGVDPYYLTTKAESLGYYPEVILAGRRINDNMGKYIGQRLVKLLLKADIPLKKAKVAILGLTFKENVPDLRNSRVPDIINELVQFNITPLVHDPLVDEAEAKKEYGIQLSSWDDLLDLDGIILAVTHKFYLDKLDEVLKHHLKPHGVLIDIKSVVNPRKLPSTITYWSL